MAFIQFTGVSVAFGDRDVLKNVSLRLKSGDKAALCGVNGAGKSTLLKIIAGIIEPDSGERALEKGSRLAYLPQELGIGLGSAENRIAAGKPLTLYEELDSVFEEWRALERRLDAVRDELAVSTGAGAKPESLLAEHDALFEQLESSGYLRREKEIYFVAKGLGFTAEDMGKHINEFSGGWQMRIALSKTLLMAPDILVLDEPTNYLDIEARLWLLAYLKAFTGALLIVSHDRYFLDSLVNAVYELFSGSLKRYTGNYTAYEKTRAVELAGLIERRRAQEAEIERLTKLAARFRYKASKASFAQEQLKKIDRMEKIELPPQLQKIHVTFPPLPHCGHLAFTLKDIAKSYGASRIIEKFDLMLDAGERLVCVGPNGAGKSTLLRIIAGVDRDFSGKVRYGTDVNAGYFSQDASERLCGSISILDYLKQRLPQTAPRDSAIRNMLGSFLFCGDDVYKPLDVLSGGEKTRLALLELLLQSYNLLILDEPTNHLDMYSKDVLLEALIKWKGSCVFVSHDRSFMEALSTKTLELRRGAAPRLFLGNYRYYIEKTEWEVSRDAEQKAESMRHETEDKTGREQPASFSREQKKQLQAEDRRRRREEDALLAAIETLETEKTALEDELARPEIYTNGEKSRLAQRKLESLNQELAEKEAAWEKLSRENVIA
ncbi:MAG: ABC-F family ATP-binding cassette domain-containing protein [Spirochaetaceae bacterium]|jgi:ATP-binding cassette subfamily F protein 3|nr:ABC-F family ATP-binding cassette domain-containing protein [Spirochaetaceae bacterium]